MTSGETSFCILNLRSNRYAWWLSLIAAAVCSLCGIRVSADEPVDYLTQVKPLLRARCYACHGGLKQEANLRLDTAERIKQGGDSGPAISIQDVDASLLLKRVAAGDPAERMPPEYEGEPLSEEQTEVLRRWIAARAPAAVDEVPESDPRQHWAFQKVVRPTVPETRSAWASNPIDLFLEQSYGELGLTPQPEAPRIILLRRLYLDLLGVPPTPDEIETFENDASPRWYEHAVDRLLEDPRHGERWARHWMDIWRYSDWWGLGAQLRNSQKHIWHWRDWIIQSLNNDTPYDEMVRQMLAADELYPNDLSKLRATGFLARNYFIFNRTSWMEETVEHVSKGLLGLTMNCAKCHDHKYDPITQTDFYRMRAFFEPYHVRLDVVPGMSDLNRDGIPRVFDALVDPPTYRLVRGDERNPDQSTVIAPGLPDVLALDHALTIEPVTLPPEAWQPGRRDWVLDTYLAEAHARVASARQNCTLARNAHLGAVAAEKKMVRDGRMAPENMRAKPAGVFQEKFETLDAKRWRTRDGIWVHTAGKCTQQRDGQSWSALRYLGEQPRNFDATVKFRILGGSMYRSLGLAFDVIPADPKQEMGENDTAQLVYVSAGGSKVQAAYRRGNAWSYPGGEAARHLAIEMDCDHLLRIQVRDALINVMLDGEPVLSCHATLERRAGAMELVTYDAVAEFDEFILTELDPAAPMRESDDAPREAVAPLEAAHTAVKQALQNLDLAQLELASAEAELESVKQRVCAVRSETPEQVAMAIRADRTAAVAKARQALFIAQQKLATSGEEKRAAIEKEVQQSRNALKEAEQRVASEIDPAESFTPFVGAKWTPTRFLNSGADDPDPKFQPTSTGRRTALAAWMTDRDNPLTARVAVNHIWTRHMGQPLLATVFEFGRNGGRLTHPELLDWLAVELMEHGWSMKHIHRLIVSSSAYRMSSSMVGAEEKARIDPENQAFWRRIPVRIESQVIRDSILALAGTLDSTVGGPPVMPEKQATSTQRSLYFFHSNNDRNLFLTTFDDALVKDCYRREQSIVPQQALALANSRLVLDSSERIAKRLSVETVESAAFIRIAFRTIVGIEPSAAEVDVSQSAMTQWQTLDGSTPESARANLVWALLNHNDFVTLR